jgi:ABC-type nitrate/sulfonate/bicarbonate transport system substrate-binding protein
VRAQGTPKLRIGYWPVAAGLPFFAAVEKGYFKEAGLDVEPLKFAGAQQVMEGMLAGRSDGSANGTGSANLAIGEIAQPGLFKIFCTNPSNAKYVLDEFIVAKDSPIKTMAELGQARRLGPRHPERHAVQDHAGARRRQGRHVVTSCRSASTWPRWWPARSTPATRWSPPAPSAA